MTKTFSPSHFSGAVEIRVFRLKREEIGNLFPLCVPNYLLDMCSEPFVTAPGEELSFWRFTSKLFRFRLPFQTAIWRIGRQAQ